MPRIAVAVLVALAVAAGTALRVVPVLRSGLLDEPAEGLLRADPAQLCYLLQRVLAGGGWPPADFAADPRIQHPDLIDCWSTFTVGQELVLAPLYLALGEPVPLPTFCVLVMGAWMSLFAVGVYLLARELSGSAGLGLVAAWLITLTPAAYRTLGFVLVREDFSLPIAAVAAALAARAARAGHVPAAVAAGLCLAAAAATWHATGLVWALAAGSCLLWYARSGGGPFARPRAGWACLATFALVAVLVPALRAKAAWASPAVTAVAAMGVTAAWGAAAAPWRRLAAVAVLGTGAIALSAYLAGGDMSHVVELLAAKFRHLGELPRDPHELSVEARMMWQGPFATLPPGELVARLGVLLPAALLGSGLGLKALAFGRAPGHPAAPPLWIACIPCLILAWAIGRLQILPAWVGAVVAAAALARLAPRARAITAVCLLAVQAAVAVPFFAAADLSWHDPTVRAELRALAGAVRRLVPEGEAVAADTVDSPAILAHTGRPVCVQPKWETRAARERAAEFLLTMNRGTLDDLASLMRGTLRCRYLVVDRYVLWLCRYITGWVESMERPPPGTAARALFADDEAELRALPHFELLWVTPDEVLDDRGLPSRWIRIFRLRDG